MCKLVPPVLWSLAAVSLVKNLDEKKCIRVKQNKRIKFIRHKKKLCGASNGERK